MAPGYDNISNHEQPLIIRTGVIKIKIGQLAL